MRVLTMRVLTMRVLTVSVRVLTVGGPFTYHRGTWSGL
jgi:hypothetical protein